MGVIEKANRTEQAKGPECPLIFISTYEKFKSLKFAEAQHEDKVVLVNRGQIRFSEIKAFKDTVGYDLTYLDVELIMGMDALFEGGNNV